MITLDKDISKEIQKKKYPCPDCFFCQCCNETKCAMCRAPLVQGKKYKKKSKVHRPLFLKY